MLTDLNMPDVDGFELIARLRADERRCRLPVIVLSAATDPKARERALQAGANAFFAKPYSLVEVRTKLEDLLHG